MTGPQNFVSMKARAAANVMSASGAMAPVTTEEACAVITRWSKTSMDPKNASSCAGSRMSRVRPWAPAPTEASARWSRAGSRPAMVTRAPAAAAAWAVARPMPDVPPMTTTC